jgi:hypothetical protein
MLAHKRVRGTVLEICGFALVVLAAWDVARPLGLAAAGLALVAIALVVEGPR